MYLMAPLKRLVLNPSIFRFLLVAGVFVTAASAYEGTTCCRKAAREYYPRVGYDEAPWNVCSMNQTDQYPEGKTFPSINATMLWCKQRCPGMQHSSLKQWLQPLATWIAPYVGLLLLCAKKGPRPEGENTAMPEETTMSQNATMAQKTWCWIGDVAKKTCGWIGERALWEYVSILGDPAGAIFGAFSEIHSDIKMIRAHEARLKKSSEENPGKDIGRLRRILLQIPGVHKQKLTPNAFDDCMVLRVLILIGDLDFQKQKRIHWEQFRERLAGSTSEADFERDQYVENLFRALRILIDARLNFFNAVFLPVVLMLAVTASVFYDAYTKLGDNDTAHGLAFGVWYSWLLVLTVASNCFASSLNSGLTKTALKPCITLSEDRVSLRERYLNSKRWEQLRKPLRSGRTSEDEERGPSDLALGRKNWLKLSAGQILGWVCVAFPTRCAATISWTTPTVGLGCRSFTFLLYGILAFATAILHVGYEWANQTTQTTKGPLKKGLIGAY